jgi:transcriptional regulator with XRE-family HTH domain
MKKVEVYNSEVIDSLLDSITPAEEKRIKNRMLLAAKIDDAIKAKRWKRKDLLNALGMKNASVITKWLSGTHNFTADTLTDIETVLGINLLDLIEKEERVVVSYHIEVSQSANADSKTSFIDEIQTGTSSLQYYSAGSSFTGSFTQQFGEA